MLGLYLNKCRTAACFFAEGYPEIKGVCVSLSMDFCSGFFACKYGLGVWSVRMNNQEVQEWNRRKNGVFGY